jgi:hypothetical protein
VRRALIPWAVATGLTLLGAPARAGEPAVTGVKAVYKDGQVFVTWKDAAEGEAGAKYFYSVYRSDEPITQDNLGKATPVIKGIHNNSCRLPGLDLKLKDRISTTDAGPHMRQFKSYLVRGTSRLRLTEDGECLPMWSGVGVHTVEKPGKGYYAVVATDLASKPLSEVVPGESATTEPVEEKVAPFQPIMQVTCKLKPIVPEKPPRGLPLYVTLHASCSSKPWTPGVPRGSGFAYFPPKEMGWRPGQPGGFGLSYDTGEHPRLHLQPRDTMSTPAGVGGVEALWFGLYCRPNWSTEPEPRAHPFSEDRVKWIVNWVLEAYGADPNRISIGGQSMGAYGSLHIGLHHPRIFAAIYPTGPRCRMSKLWGVSEAEKYTRIYLSGPTPEKNLKGCRKPPLLPDGKTEYFDYMDAVATIERNHGDLPFLCWIGGRNGGKMWGGVGPWGDQVPTVKALLENHHGFAFGWDNGTHGSAKKQFRKLCEYYPWHRFALNLSYPAFSNSSIDDDIGPDGPKEGYINLGFVWTDPVDEAGKWESTISNAEAKADMTVDVTPRRCQKFKPAPGEKLDWKSSLGDAGTVEVDGHGLVTVPGVRIELGKKTTLSIIR